MARRPRVDMVGYYHIVNRGVEQRVVYADKEDFKTFLEILCIACKLYRNRGQVITITKNIS